jgi:hypothetical protein
MSFMAGYPCAATGALRRSDCYMLPVNGLSSLFLTERFAMPTLDENDVRDLQRKADRFLEHTMTLLQQSGWG